MTSNLQFPIRHVACRWRNGWLLLGMFSLLGGWCDGLAAAGTNAPQNFHLTVTNVAQLRQLVAQEWRVRCELKLEGVVCAVSEAKQLIVLADESGAEMFELDFGGQELAPGQRISLSGEACEVTRRREGLVLSRAPMLDNDGTHGAIEKTASVQLKAGWHPIRLEWFNGPLRAALKVSHAEPGASLAPMPDASLARAITNGSVSEAGLEFECYEGGWAALPDFGQLPLKSNGVASNFDIQVRSRTNYVGLVFKGWFHARTDGTHTFQLRSDDGSRLMVGPQLPVITLLGTGQLPTLRQYFIGQSVGNADAYVWARAYGDVRRAQLREDGRMELELYSPREARLLVEIMDGQSCPPQLLLNNRVSISGVSRMVTVSGGQQIFGLVTAPSLRGLELLEVAPGVWSANGLKTISDLPEIGEAQAEGVVLHLRGRLEEPTPGAPLWLRDDTGRIQIAPSATPAKKMLGSEVETLAHCVPVNGEWVLQMGFFRVVPLAASAPERPLKQLTTAGQVQRLTREEAARGYPVRLRGVITCLWPEYYGIAILQDETRGVFLGLPDAAGRAGLEIGDFWEVEGVTQQGDFAPIVQVNSLQRISEGRMPEPARPTWDQLINGSLDAQFIELEGIISKVDGNLATVITRSGRIDVGITGRGPLQLDQFENMLVRIRGCLLASWDASSGQLRVGELRIASATIATDHSVTSDPFTAPPKSLDDLLRFDAQAGAFQRVRVSGQILSRRADEFFMATEQGGLRFISKENGRLKIGDRVEVAGFPHLGGPSPVLHEAAIRKTGAAALPEPLRLGPGNLLRADNDATRVRVEALLASVRGSSGGVTLLELQSDRRPFSARLAFKEDALPKLRPGSRLELTGVYAGQGNSRIAERKIDTFELLVDTPADVRVVAQPPWWTFRRLLTALGVLAVVLAAAMLWVFQLHRRVEAQTAIIREKVEREATLVERTRIARELHDTLEQALAGVSFQLGALAGHLRGISADAMQMLERARLMVRHGQEEARRTVRNLRMLELEGGDLPGAMEQLAREMANGLPVNIETIVQGTPAPLPGKVENHLLRIGQEAMTNAIKHANAKSIHLQLGYSQESVELKVSDNGSGFDASGTGPTEAGHFGLLGMRERANQIGGTFDLTSRPGSGTTLVVRVPRTKPNALRPTV